MATAIRQFAMCWLKYWILFSAGGSGLGVARWVITKLLIILRIQNRTAGANGCLVCRRAARGAALAGHFAVNLQDSRDRTCPRKSLCLFVSALFHPRSHFYIQQGLLKGSPDFEHILWIHHQRGVAYYFRQARGVRRHDWRSMSHSFERREPEALVERREHERLCDIVKDAQHFDWNEAEKAHILLHAAAHHCAPQPRMAGKVVADDDQFEVFELLLFSQLALQRRKRLDDAHYVFVRPDRPRIQNEWMIYQVALRDQLAVALGGVPVQKAVVDGIVDHFDTIAGDRKQLLDFPLRELRNGNNPRCAAQPAPRQVMVEAAAQARLSMRAVHVFQQIVHGHNVRTVET